MSGEDAARRQEAPESMREQAQGPVREQVLDENALVYGMATTAARAASDMFAKDVLILDLREAVSYTDYFVIASAETERQTRRIAEEVIEKMNEEGHRPRSRRIDEGSVWISLDYLDIVVHVFTDEARDYYRLESLWRGVPQERWEG